jgi:nicotinamidase-related amidase
LSIGVSLSRNDQLEEIMREAFGKQVFSSLGELVHPSHTAVIVVDMQNDLISLDRPAAERGAPPPACRAIIPALQQLLSAARGASVAVVYVLYTVEESRTSASPAWIDYSLRTSPVTGRNKSSNLEVCFEGTWGQQVVPELAPHASDFIVKKSKLGAFWATDLDQVLRSSGIQTVVITGIATAGCVADTAIGAAACDYYTVYASDCVGGSPELQEVGLALLADRYDDVPSDKLIELWCRPDLGKSPNEAQSDTRGA